jgi:hypothetical protein
MPINNDFLALRRARRWSVAGALCAAIVLILWYREHASRLVIGLAIVQFVCLAGMLLAQTRALRSASRSSAG